MIDLLEAAQSVQRLCQRRRWRFCCIGGLAVQPEWEPAILASLERRQ